MAPSHRPSSRPRSTRSAWFGLLLALAPVPGVAQTATLVFPDVCGDPSNVFDYYWAQGKLGAKDLFLFKDKNTISPISAAQGFDKYPTILVVAHGNADEVDGFAKADVASRIKAAHPTSPDTVRFFTCNAAAGPGSVLKLLNDSYGGAVQRLFGTTTLTGCALTGNGSSDLTKAEYRGSPTISDPTLFNTIVANITKEWTTGDYKGTGKSYKDFCKTLLDGNLPGVPAFMQDVFDYFSKAKLSDNYLELIKLNTGGTAPLECGKATGKACP
jgi:hypothetical protein